jgi:F5/8 type C domain-containing protein
VHMRPSMPPSRFRTAIMTAGLMAAASAALAQVGSGWTQVSYSKCAHYGGSWGGHYSNVDGVETFWISGTEQRSEIMICSPKWTSGRYQFQGEVNTRAGSGGDGGSSVQQVFGIYGRNSDAFQLRVTTPDGGSYRTQTDFNPAKVVATGVYGRYTRVNVIHDANNNRLYCYINGSLEFSGVDGGDATHYFKYGIYMRAETNPLSQWRSVKVFSGGMPGTSPTPTPTPTPTPAPTATATPCTGCAFVEITPPATGVSDSANDGNLPGNTVDNDLATRWSSNGDGQWIRYDLGMVRRIAHVKLAAYNGNSRQNRFDLQVSSDGTTWANVLTGALTSGTTTLEEPYDFDDVDARYVRYVGHMSTVGTFNSLTEVSLFAPGVPAPTAAPTPTPTATPTAPSGPAEIPVAPSGVTASTHDGNLPANTVDGSLATRWSANGDPQWIQYDLGATRSIESIRIAWYNGNLRASTFDVLVGDTAAGPWTTVASGLQSSGATTALETYDVPDAGARYVRVVGHGNNVNTWNSLTEAEVWGR